MINGIDSNEETEGFILSERERLGHLVSDFIPISATNALKAQQTNNDELCIRANMSN